MKNRFKHFHFDELTVLEVFLVVALFGLVAGATFLALFPQLASQSVVSAVQVAPTPEEYRADAAEAMKQFLSQAGNMTDADFGGTAAPIMLELAGKTQTALLALRVPGDLKDAHLAFVLLLDRWKRALSGDVNAQTGLAEKTKQLMATYPWVAPEGSGI
ncbi:MAG: hypothetical protein RLZZ324_1098 [Candidatus Parcubacteria bacterium]|jgi:hypothetical protein